jgi:hypothetical protein
MTDLYIRHGGRTFKVAVDGLAQEKRLSGVVTEVTEVVTSGRQEEREIVVEYLRSLMVTGVTPDGQPFELSDAEEHWNVCLEAVVDDIERGKHRVWKRGEL